VPTECGGAVGRPAIVAASACWTLSTRSAATAAPMMDTTTLPGLTRAARCLSISRCRLWPEAWFQPRRTMLINGRSCHRCPAAAADSGFAPGDSAARHRGSAAKSAHVARARSQVGGPCALGAMATPWRPRRHRRDRCDVARRTARCSRMGVAAAARAACHRRGVRARRRRMSCSRRLGRGAPAVSSAVGLTAPRRRWSALHDRQQ
jgi:hypothetical protein